MAPEDFEGVWKVYLSNVFGELHTTAQLINLNRTEDLFGRGSSTPWTGKPIRNPAHDRGTRLGVLHRGTSIELSRSVVISLPLLSGTREPKRFLYPRCGRGQVSAGTGYWVTKRFSWRTLKSGRVLYQIRKRKHACEVRREHDCHCCLGYPYTHNGGGVLMDGIPSICINGSSSFFRTEWTLHNKTKPAFLCRFCTVFQFV